MLCISTFENRRGSPDQPNPLETAASHTELSHRWLTVGYPQRRTARAAVASKELIRHATLHTEVWCKTLSLSDLQTKWALRHCALCRWMNLLSSKANREKGCCPATAGSSVLGQSAPLNSDAGSEHMGFRETTNIKCNLEEGSGRSWIMPKVWREQPPQGWGYLEKDVPLGGDACAHQPPQPLVAAALQKLAEMEGGIFFHFISAFPRQARP